MWDHHNWNHWYKEIESNATKQTNTTIVAQADVARSHEKIDATQLGNSHSN